MIKLKSSLLWDGHLISAGKIVALPELLEKNIVSAGNGEYLDCAEQNALEISKHPDIPDLVKRIEALKLDLSDDLSYEQVKEAVEKAEQEQQINPLATVETNNPELQGISVAEKIDTDGAEQENSPPEGQTAADPELQLGRVGRTQ